MKPPWSEEFIEVLGERAAFYRLLSSLYFKEVTDDFIERLEALELPDEAESPRMYQAVRELKHYLARRGPDPRTDLAVDYAHAFLAAGVYEGSAACPYESIYTSRDGLVMQEARDEVVAVYRANGVDVDPGLHVPEDHLSFELEFLAILSDRAADLLKADDLAEGDLGRLAGNLATQRGFIEAHLFDWLPAFEVKVVELTEQGFYPAVVHLTQAYLADDVLLLDEMGQVVSAAETTAV